jgi:hypothetical protein
MKFDLWWIIIWNDFGIVTMTITKIPILHKPIPMKHCHRNYNSLHVNIYLWRKIVCFVCHVEISQTKPWCLLVGSWYLEKPLMSKGAPSWVHNVMTYSGEVIEHWNIFSFKFHLNQNKKPRGIWLCSWY